MPQPQCRVTRNGALAGDDLTDAVAGDLQTPPQLRGAQFQSFKLLGEMFARVVCGAAGQGHAVDGAPFQCDAIETAS